MALGTLFRRGLREEVQTELACQGDNFSLDTHRDGHLSGSSSSGASALSCFEAKITVSLSQISWWGGNLFWFEAASRKESLVVHSVCLQ
jgi:hypothetical protein